MLVFYVSREVDGQSAIMSMFSESSSTIPGRVGGLRGGCVWATEQTVCLGCLNSGPHYKRGLWLCLGWTEVRLLAVWIHLYSYNRAT